jgi:N-acetylmuramoyl-L-alanine amidase
MHHGHTHRPGTLQVLCFLRRLNWHLRHYLCQQKNKDMEQAKVTRRITEIIVHCSATPANRNYKAADIRQWHIRDRRFSDIGYHYVIDLDGTIEQGRPLNQIGAHCLNHNSHSIGICYVGGLDAAMHPADTRTPQQRIALRSLISDLQHQFPQATLHGHREFAAKECPCFDVATEL